MVKIRLSRNKSKNIYSYKIIVSDSRNSLYKKFIEKIGFINFTNKSKDNFYINIQKLNFWITKGAKLSNRLINLLKIKKITLNV